MTYLTTNLMVFCSLRILPRNCSQYQFKGYSKRDLKSSCAHHMCLQKSLRMVALKNKSLQITFALQWMNMFDAFIYFDTKRY